ncbi:MAG: hypothetical protein R2755_10565 [Acidimicrobiales bacterium]
MKLVKFDNVPAAANPPGGIAGASGYRYFTMIVSNLQEIMQACADGRLQGGRQRARGPPRVTIGMVEDPDGNWVEFVQNS